MANREIFTDDDGCVYTAELVPARVIVRRTAADGTESAVGQVFLQGDDVAHSLCQHAQEAGVRPAALKVAREMLGLPEKTPARAVKAKADA